MSTIAPIKVLRSDRKPSTLYQNAGMNIDPTTAPAAVRGMISAIHSVPKPRKPAVTATPGSLDMRTSEARKLNTSRE
jgi:hypothetical protein